jgi:hypothetical protein
VEVQAGGVTLSCANATITASAISGNSYNESLACQLGGSPVAGGYTIWVCYQNRGCAGTAGMQYASTVAALSPAGGSGGGGSNVTITGTGGRSSTRLSRGRCGVAFFLGGEGGATRIGTRACPSRCHSHCTVLITLQRQHAGTRPPQRRAPPEPAAADLSPIPLAAGFSSNPSDISVLFGNSSCNVTAANYTSISCVTGPMPTAGYGAYPLVLRAAAGAPRHTLAPSRCAPAAALAQPAAAAAFAPPWPRPPLCSCSPPDSCCCRRR